MTNTYFDATGILTFDGPAIVTPVITALFKPFRLGEWASHSPCQQNIAQATDETPNDWASYADEVATAAREHFGLAVDSDLQPDELFDAIGEHFGVDLDDWIDTIDFDNGVEIADVVELARRLKDGHNLIGFCLEGAVHADRMAPGQFGGLMSFRGEHYTLTHGTGQTLRFADVLNAELATAGPSLHAHLRQWLAGFFEGIHDQALRSSLEQQFGITGIATSRPRTDEADWSRLLYVPAFAVHGENEPRWARLLITPYFIETLSRLRGHCRTLALTELRVTGSPDAWGSGHQDVDDGDDPSELVVTPHSFWYRWESGRLDTIIESEAQSIDGLLSTATGPGEPILVSLPADRVAQEFPPAR